MSVCEYSTIWYSYLLCFFFEFELKRVYFGTILYRRIVLYAHVQKRLEAVMYYVVKISVLYTSKVAFKNAVWYYIVQMLSIVCKRVKAAKDSFVLYCILYSIICICIEETGWFSIELYCIICICFKTTPSSYVLCCIKLSIVCIDLNWSVSCIFTIYQVKYYHISPGVNISI